MNIRFLIVILMLFCQIAYAEQFTELERTRDIPQLSKYLQNTCATQFSAMIRNSRASNSPAATIDFTSDVLNEKEICPCFGNLIAKGVTPKLLHSRNPDGMKELAEKSISACMLPRVKQAFPKYCGNLFGLMTKNGLAIDGFSSESLCGCVQADINGLTLETFIKYMDATNSDVNAFKQSFKLPDSGSQSLISSFVRCGFRPALAQPGTNADGPKLNRFSDLVEQVCLKKMDEVKSAIPPGTAPEWSTKFVNLFIDIPDYCSCAGRQAEKIVTPDLLDSGNAEKLKELGIKAGAQCLLPHLKTAFPDFCHSMMAEISKNRAGNPIPDDTANGFCSCVQTEINGLTDESLILTLNATKAENLTFSRHGWTPDKSSPSLFGMMARCQISDYRAPNEPDQ